MTDEHTPKPAEGGRQTEDGNAPTNAPIASATKEHAELGAPDSDVTEAEIERAAEKGVKRELRLPEWIMAGFTVVIACTAIAQCSEMDSGGRDTKRLAEATANLADAASDQTKDMAAQAKAMSSLASTSRNQLDRLAESIKAAQDTAKAAKVQAEAAQANLIASNRAWISINSAAITKDTEGNYGVEVNFLNTGHSPALGVVHALAAHDGAISNFINLDNVSGGENRTCNGLTPPPNGDVANPGAPQTAGAQLRWSGANNLGAIAIIQACFVYRTMGLIHRSSVCWFTDPIGDKPVPLEQRKLKYCADGNSAD